MSTLTTTRTSDHPEEPENRPEWIFNPAPSRPHATFEYDLAIVGLGYVGLPTALAYHHGGSRVLALDVSERRLDDIRQHRADLVESDRHRLEVAENDDRFLMTSDPSLLAQARAVIICVPTPVDRHLIPDLGILKSACDMVVAHAVAGQLVMLTSTTYVGCTEDFVQKPLEARGFRIGVDAYVSFSAERIDPGNERFDHDDVPRVIGGATPECEEEAVRVVTRYTTNIHRVSSVAAAEMTKLLENTFRAVNIALANEFADICSTLELDVTEVIDAAATKPYGFMPFYPGPGVGGHCIPCDPHYLLWQLREQRVNAPLITQAMTEIASRPGRIVDGARDLLSRGGVALANARILVVGIAYKPDVSDLRESPAIEILAGLAAHGATIGFVDTHFAGVRLPDGRLVDAVIDPAGFGADLILLHTRHTGTDLSWVRSDQLVLDATYRDTELAQSRVV